MDEQLQHVARQEMVGGNKERGLNMALWSGLPFFPDDPRGDEIEIWDIANSLAKLCRYNGHTRLFCSVAEHSVLVSLILREMGAPVEVQMQGLLHDATEAYCGDMIRPLKLLIDLFNLKERIIWRAVAQRFNLPIRLDSRVKIADNEAVVIERRDILNRNRGVDWGNMPKGITNLRAMGFDWRDAKDLFVERYVELGGQYDEPVCEAA